MKVERIVNFLEGYWIERLKITYEYNDPFSPKVYIIFKFSKLLSYKRKKKINLILFCQNIGNVKKKIENSVQLHTIGISNFNQCLPNPPPLLFFFWLFWSNRTFLPKKCLGPFYRLIIVHFADGLSTSLLIRVHHYHRRCFFSEAAPYF